MARGRKANVVPSTDLHIALPIDVRTKLDLHLYSPLEGKVPFGSHQKFFVARLREYFESQELDLSPYTGEMPGSSLVRGSAEAIRILRLTLEKVK